MIQRGADPLTLHTARAPRCGRSRSRPCARLLGVIADPNITYLLLGLGWLGLLFELMHPGAVLPGVVGAICLILAFYGLSVLPVNYAGLALILLAVLFFILEIKVTSYGMLGVAGIDCLVLGSLMLFKTPEPALRVSVELIAMLAAFSLLVVGFLAFMALRAQRMPVRTGVEGLIHEIGTARSPLAPRGKVFVHGELWDAIADEPVAAGGAGRGGRRCAISPWRSAAARIPSHDFILDQGKGLMPSIGFGFIAIVFVGIFLFSSGSTSSRSTSGR